MKELPREVYKRIKENTPADIHARVLDVIWSHDTEENRISRLMLVCEVFQVDIPATVNLSNLSADRQIRRAIKDLSKDFPILGSSGKGGYWISKNKAEINDAIRETEAKAYKMLATANQLRALVIKMETPQPLQPKLL